MQVQGGVELAARADQECRFTTSALCAADFAAEISNLNPHRLLVILDCCHADSMGAKNYSDTTGCK
jgi:hypothetical protein